MTERKRDSVSEVTARHGRAETALQMLFSDCFTAIIFKSTNELTSNAQQRIDCGDRRSQFVFLCFISFITSNLQRYYAAVNVVTVRQNLRCISFQFVFLDETGRQTEWQAAECVHPCEHQQPSACQIAFSYVSRLICFGGVYTSALN